VFTHVVREGLPNGNRGARRISERGGLKGGSTGLPEFVQVCGVVASRSLRLFAVEACTGFEELSLEPQKLRRLELKTLKKGPGEVGHDIQSVFLKLFRRFLPEVRPDVGLGILLLLVAFRYGRRGDGTGLLRFI
jgi:hypothetical protein